MKRSLHYHF